MIEPMKRVSSAYTITLDDDGELVAHEKEAKKQSNRILTLPSLMSALSEEPTQMPIT